MAGRNSATKTSAIMPHDYDPAGRDWNSRAHAVSEPRRDTCIMPVILISLGIWGLLAIIGLLLGGRI